MFRTVNSPIWIEEFRALEQLRGIWHPREKPKGYGTVWEPQVPSQCEVAGAETAGRTTTTISARKKKKKKKKRRSRTIISFSSSFQLRSDPHTPHARYQTLSIFIEPAKAPGHGNCEVFAAGEGKTLHQMISKLCSVSRDRLVMGSTNWSLVFEGLGHCGLASMVMSGIGIFSLRVRVGDVMGTSAFHSLTTCLFSPGSQCHL